MARQGAGDQETHRTIRARHIVLAATMDGAGREHQLVAHQHDASIDLRFMRLEFFRRAPTDIDHLGGEAARARRNGTDQRMACGKAAISQLQGGRLCTPASIGDGNGAPGIGRRCCSHTLTQQGKGALLTLGAREPTSAIANIVEVPPQLFIDREAAGEIGIKTHGGVHLFNLLSSMSRKAVANTDGSRSRRQKAPIS